jgi:uncharacterized membrane protein
VEQVRVLGAGRARSRLIPMSGATLQLRALRSAIQRIELPFVLTVGLWVGWSWLFGWLGVRHHRSFGSWAFDMAIYDQAFWKASQFDKTFITVRGMEMWGHHMNVVAYLFAPAYWLGAGPAALYVIQAVVLGLGVVPVYLLSRDLLRSKWMGFALAVAFALYAPVQFISWANFHPEALVITPLLFAWWAARRGYWKCFGVFAVLALTTREDAAMVMFFMGALLVWVILRPVPGDELVRRHAVELPRWQRIRVPVFTTIGAVAYYFFSTRLVIRHYNNGEDPFYVAYFFGDFGRSMFEVLGNMIRHPNRVIQLAMKPDRVTFYIQLLLPLAGLSFLGAPFLLMAAPQMLSSIASESVYSRSIEYQYPSMMIAPIFIALVEGLYRRRRTVGQRWLAIGAVLVASWISNVAWSPSPVGDRHWYWVTESNRTETLRRAVKLIPENVGVGATYNLLPHLAHRNDAYDWPNPWVNSLWGNDAPGDALWPQSHDPNRVTWIAIDRELVGFNSPSEPQQLERQVLVNKLIGPNGEFEVVMDKDDIVVARRIRPHVEEPLTDTSTVSPAT